MTSPEDVPHCGHPDEELCADPFVLEVHNEVVWRWLCGDCYTDLVNET